MRMIPMSEIAGMCIQGTFTFATRGEHIHLCTILPVLSHHWYPSFAFSAALGIRPVTLLNIAALAIRGKYEALPMEWDFF